jgi:hypothetical protein
MKATKHGIELNKAELTALLAFTNAQSEAYSAVHFVVPSAGGKLTAVATDGTRAVEVYSSAEETDALAGEWLVACDFLETCKSALKKGQICTLKVTKTGVRSAVVTDVESGEEQATITWPREAASTQISIESIRQVSRIERRLAGSWFAVQAPYLKDIALMSAACGGEPVTIYPPADEISALCFEASGYEARWSGVVMPVRVAAPGEGVDEKAEEVDPSETADAVRNFAGTLKKVGATVTFEQGNEDE